MRIGLASDSHGNVEDLVRALEHFQALKVDRVFFLGGRFSDADAAVAKARVRPSDPVAQSEGDDGFLAVFRGVLAAHAVGPEEDRARLMKRLVRVASRACPEYASGSGPKKVMELIEGHVACLVHDKSELTREDIANALVLVHGNSSQAAVVQIGPRVFVTPGHLRRPAPEGRPATWAVLEMDSRTLTLVVYGVDGREIRREKADLGGGRAKMVVK